MKPHNRPKKLTGTVGTRLMPTEVARVSACAEAAGLTTSEWIRQTLLSALECPPWARLLLAESLAQRNVTLDLTRDFISQTKPTPERIRAILANADERKFAMADARLATLTETKEPQA